MKPVLKLMRPGLLNLKPYSAQSYAPGKIYLNSNENPYPLKNAAGLNRYPPARPQNLTAAAAKFYKVKPENLLLTAGSDQGIDTLIRAFCAEGKDCVLVTAPGFVMYETYAKIQGAGIYYAPLQNGLLDAAAVINTIKTKKPKIFFLPNPCAPLGVMFQETDVLKIIKAAAGKTIVAVDEAYLEFSKTPSFTRFLHKYQNLVILRTFSKAFALAGGRLGAVIADKDIINVLGAVLPPYPVCAGVFDAAYNLLTDKTILKAARENIDLLISEREALIKNLRSVKAVKYVYPGKTNFVFIRTADDKKIFAALAKNKIIVRYFEGYGLRVSVSTPEENAAVLRALGKI